MDLAALLAAYGYPIVALGAFLEGETTLLLGGFAAHKGYLSLPLVIFTAAFASFLADQLYFFLGRRYGPYLLQRFPSLAPKARKAEALIVRYRVNLILGVRFIYGLRVAGPLALGMAGVKPSEFIALNFLAAVCWALIFVTVGFAFGEAIGSLFEVVGRFQPWFVAALVLALTLWLTLRHFGRRRR